MNKRLLILPCSARKRAGGPRPAVELYDGPLYQTYRAWARTQTSQTLHQVYIWIVSARHAQQRGLLLYGETVIAPYNQRFTAEQAAACAPQLLAHLRRNLQLQTERTGVGFARTFVALGADYRPALPLDRLTTDETAMLGEVTTASGGIGYWRQQLGRWLNNDR